MKQIFICILFMTTTGTSFCQQIKSSKQLTCEEYLTKSKNQKTAARTLLICGGVLIIVPVIIAIPGEVSFDTLDALAVIAGIGVGASLASIPLFIASGRNKRKALNPSLCVKIENAASLKQAALYTHSYPAISFKINL
jgi:hypothetical protein